MSASASSCSAWQTAVVTDSFGARNRTSGRQPGSREVVGAWSTPRASDGERGGPNQAFGAGGMPLTAQASQWCTPSVATATGGQASRGQDRQDELLLTGQAKALESELRERSVAPYVEGNRWPTPTALNRPRNDETLDKVGAHRKATAGQNTVPLYLEEVATRLASSSSSSLDPATSTDGESFSRAGLTLNPLFVEALMLWPPRWTLTVWNASACSATALSAWKRLMRCALLALASPPEAPPVQASLFG